jgi:hypothetical protein
MSQFNDFIRDGQLPDITYRTDHPEEVVHPRVTSHGGVPLVYLHNERGKSHKGFIPVTEFMRRLARREPDLAATGYRANGRQTTITFNKSERVSMSSRLEAFLSDLHALETKGGEANASKDSAVPDTEALHFVAGFMNHDNPQLVYWRPRYGETVSAVKTALARNTTDSLFELIWKSRDNSLSNAGQGVMGFDTADRLRERLLGVIEDVAADGSPANFESIVQRFEAWRLAGDLSHVPRLLIARAFAAIHPERYHTTVDASKQDRVIPWFVRHTSFVPPEGDWATKAEALAAHLADLEGFGGDILLRNMFPWFVFEQMRDAAGGISFRPGHMERLEHGSANVSSGARDITYRHNLLQSQLYELLCSQYGKEAVKTELPTGTGGFADAVVRRSDSQFDLYEIKVAATAADAVRQAMGQLLEYAYRRGGLEPARLFVVAEPLLDEVTEAFLQRMREEFGLNLAYFRIRAPASTVMA